MVNCFCVPENSLILSFKELHLELSIIDSFKDSHDRLMPGTVIADILKGTFFQGLHQLWVENPFIFSRGLSCSLSCPVKAFSMSARTLVRDQTRTGS